MELICPAGTPAAFREAVDAGADAVYCGFRDETNARNFPGLNFSREELRTAIAYAKQRKVMTFVAINTFMRAGQETLWHQAVDDAVALGADAVILADFGLMLMDPDPLKIDAVHQRLMASRLGPALVPTYSFVSISQLSEYVPSVEQYAERLVREGEERGSPSYAASPAHVR